MSLSVVNSKAALAAFDATQPEREALLNEMMEAETCDAMEAALLKLEIAERKAEEAVQLAYWEDTKHMNSRDNCLRIGIDFIRRMVEHYGATA